MKVHYNIDQLPEFNQAVLTIGTFDGVHHGHRAILEQVIKKAQEVGGESILMTFEPHPRKVVFPNDDSLKIISTLDEKIRLLSSTGLDHLIVHPFSVAFSQINPSFYIEEVLIKKIQAKHIIIGYDHRFGLNRVGDINFLKEYAHKGLFSIDEISEQQINDLKVSSSKIRNHLLEGEIEKANLQLEHPFVISGKIKKGLKLAGSLGYPTANLAIDNSDKLIPAYGTYAAKCVLDEKEYNGMVYIGMGKTLQTKDRLSVEMNIFHSFRDTFYNEEIEIHLQKYIRPDQLFNTKEELIYNIQTDKSECENYFNSLNTSHVKCTIAILNWNGVAHLEKYLESMQKSCSSEFEICVIDNASTDHSVRFLRTNFPECRVIELEENFGFAEGYNRGLREITTPYIAIVNSDVMATDKWLDPILDLLDNDQSIAAVQPKILSDRNRGSFEYAGASGGYIDQYGYPFCRGRVFDHCELDNGQYDTEKEIFWSTGAAMVVRNNVFKISGGFDGDFFAHMEEIDLCWRMKQLGHKIMVTPKSIVYHLGGGTLSYDSPNKTFLNFRNNWWMLLKNLEERKRLSVFTVRIALDIAFMVLNLVKGKFDHTKSIIRAYKEVLSTRSIVRTKRAELEFAKTRYRAKENRKGMYSILSPWRYFIKGQTTFTELTK